MLFQQCVLLVNTGFAGVFAVGKQHNIKFTNRSFQLKWLEKGRAVKLLN